MADIYEKCLKNARPIQQKMEENLYNIRILDATIKQIEKELKQKLNQMANTLKKTSKDERRRQYEAIEKLYERAKNLSDDKIRLAESNYEMVDVFIQKLDKETSSFNSYAEWVQQSNGRTHSSAGTSKESTEVKARAEEQQPAVNRRRGTAPASSSTTSSQSLKRGTAGRTNAKEMANLVKNEATEPDNIGAKGDMPIDPNEPRYCFCQQVSFGHMVACDNKDCPLEWFHFDCVDLKASPKGKWFCPKCRGDDRDSTRRQQQQTKTPKSGARGKDIPAK